ncbi:hypothetical protein LUZ60_011823 [Juncus effusus]|nr:hypothetical protein LUZ60_011823 [Juncus effusus]
MGILSNRVERSEIKAGDHIYTWRAVYTYSHHGIYVGGSKVVHFTRKKETNSNGSNFVNPAQSCQTFPDCGFQRPSSSVILSCLDCFLNSGSLYQFQYNAPPSLFLAKFRGGTCTTATPDPRELTVHRAMYLLHNGFGSYDVFENNCEDFAIYCKTGLLGGEEGVGSGIGRSGQASAVVGMPLAAMLASPFQLLVGGPVGMATVTAGMYCAGRYITDIGVRKDVVKVEVEDLAAHLGWRESCGERDLREEREEKEETEADLIDLREEREVVVVEEEEEVEMEDEEELRRKKRRII